MGKYLNVCRTTIFSLGNGGFHRTAIEAFVEVLEASMEPAFMQSAEAYTAVEGYVQAVIEALSHPSIVR